MSEHMNHRSAAFLIVFFIALGASSAFAQVASPAPVQTEPDGPLESFGQMIGLRPKHVPPADFVRESRPAESAFIPVHSPRPIVQDRLLTTDELRAKERELDALKATHDHLGSRPPAKVVYKPLQAPAPSPVAPVTAQQPPPEVKLTIPQNR